MFLILKTKRPLLRAFYFVDEHFPAIIVPVFYYGAGL